MRNPLIINVRCSCIEEYVRLQEIHKQYMDRRKAGDILSICLGADESLRGRYEVVDGLLDKLREHPLPTASVTPAGDGAVLEHGGVEDGNGWDGDVYLGR